MKYRLYDCSALELEVRPPLPTLSRRLELDRCLLLADNVDESDIARLTIEHHVDAAPMPMFHDGQPLLFLWASPEQAPTSPPVMVVVPGPQGRREHQAAGDPRKLAEVFPLARWAEGRVPPPPEPVLLDHTVPMRTPYFIGEMPAHFRVGRWKGRLAIWFRPETFSDDCMVLLDDEMVARLRAALAGGVAS